MSGAHHAIPYLLLGLVVAMAFSIYLIHRAGR